MEEEYERIVMMDFERDLQDRSDQEYVALTRLRRFIRSANKKMEKLEAVLPTPPNVVNSMGSTANLPRQGLNKLRQRGRRFLKWNRGEVDEDKVVAIKIKSAEEDTRFYRFLKRTTEELAPVLVESDGETMVMEDVDGVRGSMSASPLLKFSRIYEDHFTSRSRSSTTLQSMSMSMQRSSSVFERGDHGGQISAGSSRSGSLPCTMETYGSDSVCEEDWTGELSVDAEQVIKTLDFLDEHLDLFIEDPSSIKKTIQFYNWDNACEAGRERHLHFYELPFPWRENRYIIHGYRFYDSHYKSLLSIVNWYGWHNETLNIWTHLFGAIYLVYVVMHDFHDSVVYQSEKVPYLGKLMIQLFLWAGIKCLISSSTWHTLNGTCCLPLRSKFACIDYTGITVLITASILSTEFVSVYDIEKDRLSTSMTIYMCCSLLLGVVGTLLNWSPKFDRPESRPLRIAFYVLLAGLGLVSFLHLTLTTGIDHSSGFFKPVWNRSLIWYMIGVAFYGSFIPERWRTDVELDCLIPTNDELCSNLDILTKHKHMHFRKSPFKKNSSSKFFSLWWVDYCLSSHTLWHLFVLMGVVGHYHALLDMFAKKWSL